LVVEWLEPHDRHFSLQLTRFGVNQGLFEVLAAALQEETAQVPAHRRMFLDFR